MPKLGFIGAGTVGTALAIRLSERGYPVVAVSSRSQASADKLAQAITGSRAVESSQAVADSAELVFITTPDDSIPKVAAELKWHLGQSVVHCSGVTSTDALESAKQQGAMVGSIHPCQTFTGIDQAIENLPGSTFAIEAEEPLRGILTDMTRALDGDWVYLTAEDKALYHAAASIACVMPKPARRPPTMRLTTSGSWSSKAFKRWEWRLLRYH